MPSVSPQLVFVIKPRPLAVIRNRRLNSVALLDPLRSVQFSDQTGARGTSLRFPVSVTGTPSIIDKGLPSISVGPPFCPSRRPFKGKSAGRETCVEGAEWSPLEANQMARQCRVHGVLSESAEVRGGHRCEC